MTTLQASAQAQLRAFIERVECLDEEIKDKGQDRKEVFAEAKGVGFDVKIMKKIIARRKRSKSELQEEDALIATYLHALGDTPIEVHIKQYEDADA